MDLYLDNAATTPLLPEVKQVLVETLQVFGNPSSLHRLGVEAEKIVHKARRDVLRTLGATEGRLVFTGSGTEANNLAVLGVAKRFRDRGNHVVTTQIEHPCVREAYRDLERQGWEVTYVAPERDGSVEAHRMLDAVRDDTVLVSMMHVNNETGAILPVDEVGRALRQRGKTVFHVDGTQAYGKLRNPIETTYADLYAVSAHKLGGPKGVGGLFLRRGMEIDAIAFGGGQEFGLRSGTENVLGIAGFGAAARAAELSLTDSLAHVEALAAVFRSGLSDMADVVLLTPPHASPYIVSAFFVGLKGEVLLHALEAEGIFVSTGAACSSRKGHSGDSPVLKAMQRTPEEITGALRFSFARWQSMEDIEAALDVLRRQVAWLRSVVPSGSKGRGRR